MRLIVSPIRISSTRSDIYCNKREIGECMQIDDIGEKCNLAARKTSKPMAAFAAYKDVGAASTGW